MLDIVEETGSTNTDLLSQLATGAGREGDWLVARRQTAGRGRLGRQWMTEIGNFHGSTIVTISPSDPPAPTLALVAAVALHAAIVDATRGQCVPVIKWPNDLLVRHAKLAGILLERTGDSVVVGTGVNLAWSPELADRETIALATLGHRVTPDDLLAGLACTFAAELLRWRTEPLDVLVTRWLTFAHRPGTAITVSDGVDAGLTGAFDGLDALGNLRLRLADGRLRTIHAGEIRLASTP